MEDKDEKPIIGFDQTNGVVSGLEGDDNGEANPEGDREAVGPFQQNLDETRLRFAEEEVGDPDSDT